MYLQRDNHTFSEKAGGLQYTEQNRQNRTLSNCLSPDYSKRPPFVHENGICSAQCSGHLYWPAIENICYGEWSTGDQTM